MELGPGGGELIRLSKVLPPERPQWPEMVCACDVTNPLLGPRGATAIYGPQKGVVSEEQQSRLERGLERLAGLADLSPDSPMVGAAGGLAYGLAAFCGARLEPGASLVLQEQGFDRLLASADLVITGEGRLDSQTVSGKAIGELLRRARSTGVPVYAVCGVLGAGWEEVRDLLAAPPVEAGHPERAFEAVAHAAERLAQRLWDPKSGV